MFENDPKRTDGPREPIPFEQVVLTAFDVERGQDYSYYVAEATDEGVDHPLDHLATAATQCGLSREVILSFSRFDDPTVGVPEEVVEALRGQLVKVGMTIEYQGQEMVVLGLSGSVIDSQLPSESPHRRQLSLGDILPFEREELLIDQIELAPKRYFDMGSAY